ncbi:hypothetical protein X735_30645 [Mesorhizobium sp. L2C085B000]|uniref:hypothetical protein n=1 Tax=unclassified Mesorhizobium TaxID=325217 RepID=UPI0003CFB7BE|nr:hypothetical protein [Mesorhizobium sp. L2C085B000]ESZ08023.1 hypothetical protein X735_30645 [Mesorhizobium sp. L2C085B000]
MILRSWHGVVPSRLGDAFDLYFRKVVIDEIEDLPGNLGVFFRLETQGEFTHIFLITYWDCWASIRRFAGANAHMAVTYPDDLKYELISDPIVLHQECLTIQPWYGES